jgi:hypothetical protein
MNKLNKLNLVNIIRYITIILLIINLSFFPGEYFFSDTFSLMNQGFGGMIFGLLLVPFPNFSIFTKEKDK